MNLWEHCVCQWNGFSHMSSVGFPSNGPIMFFYVVISMSLLCCWAGGPWIISPFAARASHWLSLWSQWKSLLHREDAAVFLTPTQKPAEPPPVSWLTPSRLHRLLQLSEHCNVHHSWCISSNDVHILVFTFTVCCLKCFLSPFCVHAHLDDFLSQNASHDGAHRRHLREAVAEDKQYKESVMWSNWETEKVTVQSH